MNRPNLENLFRTVRRTAVLLVVTSALFAQPPAGSAKAPRRAAVPPAADVQKLRFPPLREVKIPEVAEFRLSNGLRVLLLEDHELPLVSGTALVRTGALLDPPEKVGLAEITGSVMRTGGTKDQTGDELDERLENLAASVETSIGETSGNVTFRCLKGDVEKVLEIFRDMLTQPAFRQDKIDLVKTQLRSAIARRNDQAPSIASREFSRIVYGPSTPYGRQLEYEHLERVTREDLIAFHGANFHPQNMLLAVYGDFQTEEVKPLLERMLGNWNPPPPATRSFPPVDAKPQPGVFLAKKEDVNQSFLRLGHLGGMLDDPDYPALSVMSDILGGSFSSRLFRKVRTELGYAYNIAGGWGANYRHPGLFAVAGSVSAGKTVESIQAVLKEIERIRSEEVTEQELNTAKSAVLNSFVFNFDRPSKTLNRMLLYEYFGYPRDFLKQYQEAVARVTRADILRVAKKHLRPEDLTIVVVGNPAQFDKPLTELGLPVKELDLTIPMPQPKAERQDPSLASAAREMFARAQAAVGGVERIQAVRDYRRSGTARISVGQGGSLEVKAAMFYVAPSFVRTEQELPFGKVVVFSDGKGGWMITPQGEMALPPAVARQVREEMFRTLPFLLLSDKDPDRSIGAVSEDVLLITDRELGSVRLQVDRQTGLPRKLMFTAQTPQGPVEAEQEILEWKEAAGVKWPSRTITRQGAAGSSETVMTEITVNGGLSSEQLSKKP